MRNGLTRVGTLSGYFEAMAEFGADVRPLLKEQGLSISDLTNSHDFIPALSAIRLLERSSQVTGCVTLGLRMAEGRTLANLGAPGLLIAHQPTLRDAIRTLGEFRSVINSTLILDSQEQDGEVVLREHFFLNHPESARQATDLGLGVLVNLCKSVLGNHWYPVAVHFSHQPPPAKELSIFQRIFRCRLIFDSEFNGIVIDSVDLDRPNEMADPLFAMHAKNLLESVMNTSNLSIAHEVDRFIRTNISFGPVTIQQCARSMGMAVRTLQRLLDSEDKNFSKLLTHTRMHLANQYLLNPRLQITEISNMLGYSSISAFTRWHVNFFGQTPLERRRQILADPDLQLADAVKEGGGASGDEPA